MQTVRAGEAGIDQIGVGVDVADPGSTGIGVVGVDPVLHRLIKGADLLVRDAVARAADRVDRHDIDRRVLPAGVGIVGVDRLIMRDVSQIVDAQI